MINHTNIFLGQHPKITEIKAKLNRWDLIKHTSFCTTKETTDKRKTYRMGEVFVNKKNKGLISKIHKQLNNNNKEDI